MQRPAELTLVNTARGFVVDLPDLLGALDAGILRGVALGLLPTEPVPRDSPLLTDPRVILTPHAACHSVEAERGLRSKAARNIVTWFRVGRPDYPVVKGTRGPQSGRGGGRPNAGAPASRRDTTRKGAKEEPWLG